MTTRRRLAVLALALGLPTLAAPAKEKAKHKETAVTALEAISHGDAYGPFVATAGRDGRGHVAYVSRPDANGPGQLWYRSEAAMGRWAEPELVLRSAPGEVALAVGPEGPVVAFSAADGVYLATRHEGGFAAILIATSVEAPSGLALGAAGTEVHALILLGSPEGSGRRAGAEPVSVLRRVTLSPQAPPTSVDLPLQTTSTAAPAPSLAGAVGTDLADHLLLLRLTPGIRTIGLEDGPGGDPEGLTTLVYTRGARSLLPLTLLTSSRPVGLIALALVEGEPAFAWTERTKDTDRLYYQQAAQGRFNAAELLLESAEPIRSLALGSAGRQAVLAIATGRTAAGRFTVRWFDGLAWGPWQRPPGIERNAFYGTAAIAFLGGAQGRARVVAQEVPVPRPTGSRRLVEWTVLARAAGGPRP